MASSVRVALLGAVLLLFHPAVANAGMPLILLTEMARMRVQSISFFLAGLLISAALIQKLWNYLRKDFASLPRLTYPKAVGVVALWGLLFVLVLTMISGARELMTPGAWEKQGATYRLADKSPPLAAEPPLDREREKQLDRLWAALWNYARSHDGRFPGDRSVTEIAKERWHVPEASGMQYLYIGGLTAGREDAVLAYEPELFGSQRLVLYANGDIKRIQSSVLDKILTAEKK